MLWCCRIETLNESVTAAGNTAWVDAHGRQHNIQVRACAATAQFEADSECALLVICCASKFHTLFLCTMETNAVHTRKHDCT